MTITFDIDYIDCPQGHRWIHVPSSLAYPDVFWCDSCDRFYVPTVKPLTREELNKDFTSDRAASLIAHAKFLDWRSSLGPADMPIK